MKFPRDLTAQDLIRLGSKFGYQVSRQSGSHIRLTTNQNGTHHITIPNHKPLKIGTLSAIISEMAAHFGVEKATFISMLFG
jgi:predicted RNA binding protein YcfA (HicA-like mRNA interferase family)